MEQSRLVKHILGLSPKARERFRLFVRSPYFNQHEKTSELLNIILEAGTDKGGSLERERVHAGLFPGTPYDEQQLHNVMSYLKKLYHRFLAVEGLEKQDYDPALYTLLEANELKQFDLMGNRSQQLEKNFEAQAYRDEHYHYVNYRYHHLMGYYLAGQVNQDNTAPLQRMLDHLDRFYLIAKLHNCCTLTANMISRNKKYDFGFLEPLLDFIQANWSTYSAEPAVELYVTILRSLREVDNPEHYKRLKDIMAHRLHLLSPADQAELYESIQNFCIRQINAKKREYQRELFELYQQGVRKGLVFSNGMLSEWVYKNIATLASSLKEFEWCEHFIINYKDKLPPHLSENAYNYNLGYLYYNQGKYSESLSALREVQFTDVRYHLNTNFLLMRTFYAMNDTEALFGLLETLRIYVIRNRKINARDKKGYTNLLRYAKQLTLLKSQAGTFSRKALAEKLDELELKMKGTDPVMNIFWLESECENLRREWKLPATATA
jgi:hypothetical protein